MTWLLAKHEFENTTYGYECKNCHAVFNSGGGPVYVPPCEKAKE